ncbi:hypothetical protein XENOCAPTIV_006345, partial [Xenoophorus captivus]
MCALSHQYDVMLNCLQAVCCAGLAQCSQSGFHCNLATKTCMKSQPWMNISVVKEAAETLQRPPKLPLTQSEGVKNDFPDQIRSKVYCEHKNYSPGRTKCCRHPKGAWFCCYYFP